MSEPGTQPVTHDGMLDLLAGGELTVEGRVLAASNLTLYARVDQGDATVTCVYKPVSGERPLWDFPDGTLAGREVAAYRVSVLGGWDLVPPTVLRDGPLGPGMCQQWVLTDPDEPAVDVVPSGEQPPGWASVAQGRDGAHRPVVLVHSREEPLRAMALLDAVLNNADRKGGHVLRTSDGGLVGVDHGLCFHAEPKLRTVLWGWAGEPLRQAERARLEALLGALERDADVLGTLITADEVDHTMARVAALLADGCFPRPGDTWPAIPWPPF